MGLINEYPYTSFSDINLDYIIKLCRETQGLHLEVSGDRLLLKSADGTIVSNVDISHAQNADLAALATRAVNADSATSALSAGYASTAGVATLADTATNANHVTTADSATSALSATNATNATYATTAGSATNATNAINAQTAAYAETTGSVTHATDAIESITINGNKIRFTTYGGSNTDIECPYSVKALKDDLGNVIKSSYVANVVNDPDTGKLKFLDATGASIVELIPATVGATEDSYGNTIADYIKAIIVSSNSNYVTVNHGNGTTDSITIHYSETAWKDSNGNIIKNSYVKRLAVVVDPNDGKRKLVAYNGDTPEAEIFRIELNCYSAQVADRAYQADNATTANFANSAAEATHANSADTTSNGDDIADFMKEVVFNDTQYGVQNLVFNSGNEEDVYSVNLFERSKILIGFFDKDKTNPDDIYSLAVNGQVTYTVDPNTLGWYKCDEVDDILKEGVVVGYINTSDQMIMRCRIYYSNGYYYVTCFDHTSSSLKVFMFWQGTLATDIVVKRVL